MAKKGFTLIEVLIVVTLIGILVAILVPQYKYSVLRAKEAVLKENLFQVRDAINKYYFDKKKYPSALEDLVTAATCARCRSIPSIRRASGTWSRPSPWRARNWTPRKPRASSMSRAFPRLPRWTAPRMPSGEPVGPPRAGEPSAPRRRGGYVMLVLMIAVVVLAVLLLMAVPLWQTEAQREAEEELIFRARQYVTAIGFYVKAHNNLYPQNFEILHLEKHLRQLYPDPMSVDGRWDMVFQDTSGGGGKYLVVPAHMAQPYIAGRSWSA